MRDFELILQAYEASGGDPRLLQSDEEAKLVVNGGEVLGSNEVDGIHMTAEPLEDGIKAMVRVDPGAKIAKPVHLCFGMVPERGVQRIVADFDIGPGAEVSFQAHCTFPNAVQVQHIMEGTVHVGAGARMAYREVHFHGPEGGVEVLPVTKVTVDRGGYYGNIFSLSHGRAGKVDIDVQVDVDEDGVAELDARVMGSADDDILIRETLRLNGRGARGLAKSRIALSGNARGEVIGTTEGNAPLARGHIDCTEIVRDNAIANAVPIVRVTNNQAHVTHEAAIGTVDKKELETLMSRGVPEEKAVDVIVRGMLGE